MMFISVDLPIPEGAMIATNSPFPMFRSTPASTCTSSPPFFV